MLNGLARPRLLPRWPWYGTAIVVATGIATIAVLVVVVEHKQSQFPQAGDCPRAATVNRFLGTHVTAPSAVSEADLLGCFYRQGHDEQAVSVSFALAVRRHDPCHTRPPVHVSGDVGCDATGVPGTARTGASLVVDAHGVQYQFSSDQRGVPLARLEVLAKTALASPPPHLQNAT